MANSSDTSSVKSFNRLALWTLVAVYFLILVGAIVRSTGSGMGCPDWPKCFGSWAPPSSVNELPSNYKEIFSASRIKKNEKFVRMLRAIGMEETASKIESDKAVLAEEDFSVIKSRIEYLNRLVGVAIGFLITLVLYRSFRFRKSNIKIFIAALIAWIAVVFTGWFGSIVVSTNLTPWTVSVHLGFALLIVAMLVYIYQETLERDVNVSVKLPVWLISICFLSSILQIIFGVQVRQALDNIAFSVSERGLWISNLGTEFMIHRSFSWIVVLANGFLWYKLRKISVSQSLPNAVAGLTLASIITGVGMAYGSVPAYLQPLHLLISSLSFGILLLMLLKSRSQNLKLQNA